MRNSELYILASVSWPRLHCKIPLVLALHAKPYIYSIPIVMAELSQWNIAYDCDLFHKAQEIIGTLFYEGAILYTVIFLGECCYLLHYGFGFLFAVVLRYIGTVQHTIVSRQQFSLKSHGQKEFRSPIKHHLFPEGLKHSFGCNIQETSEELDITLAVFSQVLTWHINSDHRYRLFAC